MERTRKAQTYDKDNIFVTIRGEKVNVYKMIQEAREDTEIIPTLEKYGCIEKLGFDPEKTYNNFVEITDLRDIYVAKEKADSMWENLPIEVRKVFNNNADEFMRNGEKWLKEQMAKDTEVPETTTQQQEQPKEN